MKPRLDLSQLDEVEAHAKAEGAVQDEAARLHTALGADAATMSAGAQARLRSLAASTSAEIEAVMRDKSLSDGERAAKVAQIRAASRARSQRLLEDDERLQLEAAHDALAPLAEVE